MEQMKITPWMQRNAIWSSCNSNFTRAILWCCWDPCRNKRSAMLSKKKSVDKICDNIIKIALRCCSHNIPIIFISSIAYNTKVNLQLIRNLNGLLNNACTKYGFHFVYNGAFARCDLWNNGIYLLETGKRIIANIFISSINYF